MLPSPHKDSNQRREVDSYLHIYVQRERVERERETRGGGDAGDSG